ncbi:MAG TPA: MlaD family protein [Bryobacteraceae bacterium]|nr:MlaD family protein [Bryobacteraceae bacterium]HWB98204.1 MlaD family protein [Bryobacteraceae bacterium]
MPSKEKVEWAKLKTGILATVAMIILGALIFLLTGNTTILEHQALIKTFMADSAGMAQNAPVRLNGILVGHIKDVHLSGSSDPKRTVEVDMLVPEHFLDKIPEDSRAAISASNLLGDKYINITRGTHKAHVQENGEIASLTTQDVPEILAQSSSLLSQFQTILGRLDGLLTVVENGQGNLGKLFKDTTLYDRLSATAGEVEDLVKDIHNSNGTISHLLYDPAFFDDIRRPIHRIDDMLAELQQQKGTVGKLLYNPDLHDQSVGAIEDVRATIAEAKKMLDDLNAGKGTAGKLLKDDDVHNQIDQIVKKINVAMDKINSGQGTVGQLISNPALYDSLNTTAQDAGGLLKDFRANPKKFMTIRLVLF